MTYPHTQWRLLITPPSNGRWNMAVDEMLLEAVSRKQSLPTLRLYAWEPACLSIGYAQPTSDIDQDRLADSGWDWVRRPTGGRAILHTDELTYSVTAPLTEPRVSGGVLESYQRLSKALLAALHTLNIPASSHPINAAHNSQTAGAVCFEIPSNYEIVVGEKKLIGSAQARRKGGLLQHGTLALWGDLARITRVLSYPDEPARHQAASRLLAHATTVESVLQRMVEWEIAAQAFMVGFQTELDLELIQIELAPHEISSAEQIMEQKYAHHAWLSRI